MSRYRCNSRVIPLALYAGMTLSMTANAFAAGQPHPFVFTAYPKIAGGQDLVTGRYRTAARQLRYGASGHGANGAAINTNRCVAYFMTRQWHAAQSACDTAVRQARRDRFGSPSWADWSSTTGDERLAAAYTDRGVMRWLSHDKSGAQKDFAKARELSPYSNFVKRNLTAVKFHGTEVRARGS